MNAIQQENEIAIEGLRWLKNDIKDDLEHITDEQLSEAYKASSQLSDLCWQEIKRRREK